MVFALLLAGQGMAEVVASPDRVVFHGYGASCQIRLSSGGRDLAPAEIKGWRLLASGHDYIRMLRVEKVAGGLRIAPSPLMEVGTYELEIRTAQGVALVDVAAPLDEQPDIVNQAAKSQGISEEEARRLLGLTRPIGREAVELAMPPRYYEGQTLQLSMPHLPGRRYAWFINGELYREGEDEFNLVYVFPKPGRYVVDYVETALVDGARVGVARGSATTEVAALDPVPFSAKVNTVTSFRAPSGYRSYVWRVEGAEVSREATLQHRFKTPGTYTVECLATSPLEGHQQGFLRQTYAVTVGAK
jgi:hypothetical protein